MSVRVAYFSKHIERNRFFFQHMQRIFVTHRSAKIIGTTIHNSTIGRAPLIVNCGIVALTNCQIKPDTLSGLD